MAIKLSLTSLFCLFIFTIFSQNDTIQFWVQFTDKNNSPYSINAPNEFLSQRAIDRRAKQNIAIEENDIPVNSAYIDSILNSGNFHLKNTSRWLNAITISTNDSVNITVLNNISFVQTIKNVQYLTLSNNDYNAEELSFEKELIVPINNQEHYPYGLSYNQLNLHHIQHLHEYGLRGQGVHIAVIDAGFLNVNTTRGLEHLFSENRVLSTKDFVNHDGDVYHDHFHGAAVLSIIAGNIPGEYYGSAPKASFHLLRSENADNELIVEEDNWIAAAEYADSVGVDMINTSLGYTQFDDTTQNHTYSDLDGNTTRIAIASDIAASKGILLVTSAGNNGTSDWKYISTPADADSILTIGAVNEIGIRGDFSSVGPSADGDIKPNIASVGWDTYYISPFSQAVERGSGTSFSAPMATGMIACLWQGLPHYNNMQIKQLVEESSNQYNSPDSLIGYGIPDISYAYQKATGVKYITPKNNVIQLYPNPFYNHFNLKISSTTNQNITIEIYNNLGAKIKTTTFFTAQGFNQTTIQIDKKLDAGYYTLKIIFEDNTIFYKKVIKGI